MTGKSLDTLNRIRRGLTRLLSAPDRISLILEQRRCLAACLPVPFEFEGKRLFMAPDLGSMFHVKTSTQKVARLVSLIPFDSSVILDVGAHSGLFSCLSAMRVPDARILAFEPNTDLQTTLEANCRFSKRIELIPEAVGSAAGLLELFINREFTQTSSALIRSAELFMEKGAVERRTVRQTSLDEALSARGIERADVVKVDIQGFEREALQGAADTISSVRVLLLEASFMDFDTVGLVLGLRDRFAFAYAINDVFLGADIALTNSPLVEPREYITRLW
jgi:FkbM family methyltransferase